MVICYGVVMAKSAEAPEVIQVDLAWARSEAQRQKGDELRMRAATGQTAWFFFWPFEGGEPSMGDGISVILWW